MGVRGTVGLAALLASTVAAPASATGVERCTYGEAGRVVTVGDTVLALCASARPCGGWIGGYATVNGEVWLDTCTDAHIDDFEQTPCAIAQAVRPGIPGVVDIDWDGDTRIDGYPVLECPPFGW